LVHFENAERALPDSVVRAQTKRGGKTSKEWLALRGVAEFAKQFSEPEFALASLAQRLFPGKWAQQAALFDRVSLAAAASGGSAGPSGHIGRKTAAQLQQLHEQLLASAAARAAVATASLQPAPKRKSVAKCPSCKMPLAGHDKGKCAAVQREVSKVVSCSGSCV
jgi:hypothetical protein